MNQFPMARFLPIYEHAHKQMRQMRHFIFRREISDLEGQVEDPGSKSRKSVAFCHTEEDFGVRIRVARRVPQFRHQWGLAATSRLLKTPFRAVFVEAPFRALSGAKGRHFEFNKMPG